MKGFSNWEATQNISFEEQVILPPSSRLVGTFETAWITSLETDLKRSEAAMVPVSCPKMSFLLYYNLQRVHIS